MGGVAGGLPGDGKVTRPVGVMGFKIPPQEPKAPKEMATKASKAPKEPNPSAVAKKPAGVPGHRGVFVRQISMAGAGIFGSA